MRGAPRKRSSLPLVGGAAAFVIVAGLLASRGHGQATAPRTEVQGDTVRELATRLTWQRTISTAAVSFAGAAQHCADLILQGQDDWRVPTMQELQTIVDEDRANPSIDPGAFPDTPGEGFWSSSPWAGTPSLAWHVDFDTGGAAYDSATMLYRVRCVRWQP